MSEWEPAVHTPRLAVAARGAPEISSRTRMENGVVYRHGGVQVYTGLSAPPCASGLEDAAAVDVLDAQAPVAFCATTFSGSLILYDEQGARLAHAPSLGELE